MCALYKYDSLSRLKLEGKKEMATRGVDSPDEGDALALTFAFPAAYKHVNIGNIYNPDIIY